MSIERGMYEATLVSGLSGGMLAYLVKDLPSGSHQPFYSPAALKQINPRLDSEE
jgi:hypothetical protein